jgi:hypothetical protein
MLDNTITLSVDPLNDTNPEDQIFGRQDEFQNRSVYTGPDHTLAERELMTFYRTAPKPSGNFKGVAKSAIKFSTDVSVEGKDSTTNVAANEIGEVSFSIPVGTTAAQAMLLRQRLIAILDDDSIMTKCMEGLVI